MCVFPPLFQSVTRRRQRRCRRLSVLLTCCDKKEPPHVLCVCVVMCGFICQPYYIPYGPACHDTSDRLHRRTRCLSVYIDIEIDPEKCGAFVCDLRMIIIIMTRQWQGWRFWRAEGLT